MVKDVTRLFVVALISGLVLMPAVVMAAPGSSKTNNKDDVWQRQSRDDDTDNADNKNKLSGSKAKVQPLNDTVADTTKKVAGNEPGDVLDLKNWYLTLPTGSKGKPDTIQPAELLHYSSPYMKLNDSGDGVVFTSFAGGVTTENSKYPRSELREMNGTKKASWDGKQGTHTMEVRQAVTKIPPQKSDVVIDQIHATSDDLMQVELTGKQLIVKYADGKKRLPIIDDYQLGDIFTIKIESADGHVKVWYNDEQKADLPISSGTSYFKVGNYLQTNTSKGDSANATAEVVLYDVKVSHQ